jgi:hypothetical protein
VTLTLFCLLVVTVVLPVTGLLTEVGRANPARTPAAVRAAQRGEDAS